MDSNTILTIVIAVVGLAVALFALNKSRTSSGASEARPAEAPAMPAPPAPKAAPAAPRAPQVEAGIPPEVVAVIAAAVYAMGGGKYTLKAVRRADRSAWARAGVLDVTEPF